MFIHPGYYSSHSPVRTFFHAPRCRRGSRHSDSATALGLPVHFRDIPTGYAVLASTVLGICSSGFFHVTMLPPTPRSLPRQRHYAHHGNFRARIFFCSGSHLGPPSTCSCWFFMNFSVLCFFFTLTPSSHLTSSSCRWFTTFHALHALFLSCILSPFMGLYHYSASPHSDIPPLVMLLLYQSVGVCSNTLWL